MQEDRSGLEVTLLLILLGFVMCAGLAVWASVLAWNGNWKAVAMALGAPLAIAALLALSAASGALDSGHSEDWGPLMALLIAGAMGAFCAGAAIIAGLAGFLGHRRRMAELNNTF